MMGGVEGKDKDLDRHWEVTLDMIEKLGKEGDQGLMEFYGRKITADLAVGLEGVEMLRAAEENILTEEEVRRSEGRKDGRSEGREERSDDRILHSTKTNNLPLVASLIAGGDVYREQNRGRWRRGAQPQPWNIW